MEFCICIQYLLSMADNACLCFNMIPMDGLGLRRNTVQLLPHRERWIQDGKDCISMLYDVLRPIIRDIQHVGSTAIPSIHAKPIIDIAVGVKSVYDVLPYRGLLEENGVSFRGEDIPGQLLFVMGDFTSDIRTHHIHVVRYNSRKWNDYILFCEYMNTFPLKAMEYERVKMNLATTYRYDRKGYTNAKSEFVERMLKEINEWKKLR